LFFKSSKSKEFPDFHTFTRFISCTPLVAGKDSGKIPAMYIYSMKKLGTLILTGLILFFMAIALHAGNGKADSLISLLSTANTDSSRFRLESEIARLLAKKDTDNSAKHALRGLEFYKKLGNTNNPFLKALYMKYAAVCFTSLGLSVSERGNYQEALRNFLEALHLREKLNAMDSLDPAGRKTLAQSYHNVGLAADRMGDPSTALINLIHAADLRESLAAANPNDKQTSSAFATTLNVIAGIYIHQKRYVEGDRNYENALAIFEKQKDEEGVMGTLNNLSLSAKAQGKFEKAIEDGMKAKSIAETIHSKFMQAAIFNNMGGVYYLMHRLEDAERSFREAIASYSVIHDDRGTAGALTNLGTLLLDKKNPGEAMNCFTKAEEICQNHHLNVLLMEVFSGLGSVYAAKGDFKNAYTFNRKYQVLKDTLVNSENLKQQNEMETKYETLKKDKEIIILNKAGEIKAAEIEKQKAEAGKQQTIRNAFICGFVLVLLFGIVIFNAYRDKGKANEIIAKQKTIVEEKNKDITDSIHYAQRIQSAVLPSDEMRKHIFPDSFILFRPKDIVSGDFYWASEKNKKKIIAIVDCTGHGVPGAFMSLIGSAFLNEIVNELGILDPAEILHQLRDRVIRALKQTETGSTSRDGMDAVVCVIDEEMDCLRFACANNPLWLMRDGAMMEFQADKIPVGTHEGDLKPFTLQTLNLKTGDQLYMFSDGYADQFGGPKGKKFKYKALKELLLNIQHLSMAEQEKRLGHCLEDWKGNISQVDDILVMGIRI
jgi:serine phosphatase RsbU (regulator of sigma subunit)/Tfp pilus assembly protein PilF